jgi:hypothetical protein
VVSLDNLMTYVPALNNMSAFASLRESQGRVDIARLWYSQALLGYEKTFEPDHGKYESLRTKLALLALKEGEQSSSAKARLIEDSSAENVDETVAAPIKPAFYRHRLVAKVRRKLRQG